MITLLLKSIILLYLLTWVTYTIWNLTIIKNSKEFKSMQRWFLVVTFLGVFGILTQWIMFFPAWVFRKAKKNPFWWWLDDSRIDTTRPSGWAEDYEIHLNGRTETIWVAYMWHMRNMIWNLQSYFKVKPQTITSGNQNIIITRMIEDTITDGYLNKLDVDGEYGQFAGLKYWKDGVSTWQTMNGEEISLQKSIIGKGFYFYINGDQPIEDNQLNWTYTSCKLVPFLFFWKKWRTIQMGMKSKGYSRQLKYQKMKPWK